MKKTFLFAALLPLFLWAQDETTGSAQPMPPDGPNPPPPAMEQPPPPAASETPSPYSEPLPPQVYPQPRQTNPNLGEQERELLDKHRENAAKGRAGRGLRKGGDAKAAKSVTGQKGAAAKTSASSAGNLLNVDYVEEPILDVLRAIATAFKLSIIPDKDLGDVKVTIHLENIPVIEGLEKLCKSHGLELIADGNVYRVRKTRENAFSIIEVRNRRMNLDVQNRPIKDFLRELVEKTRINIVPGQDLRGQVTGHLKDVDPIDGFKALMAANAYDVRLKNGVYLVENGDSTGQENPYFHRGRRQGQGFPGQGGGNADVDVHDGKVTLNLNNAALGDAIREIAEQAGLNYTIIGDVSGNVNAQLKGVTVNEALSALLNGTRYAFIRKDGTLLIGDRNPNTPSGQALSGAELVYLKYIKAENIEKIVPKTVPAENIKVIKEQNAVLISGTTDDIELVKTFIDKVDVPTPQVLMEVVVVEYNREKSSDFGLQAGANANQSINLNASGSMSGVQSAWSKGSWTGLIGIKPPSFDISLKALEAKNKAKILSMPKITTLNGNKAELRVSRTSYFPVSSFNKDGFQNMDYRTIDDGITIELTPWVTKHGEVNVAISPSVKTTEATNLAGAPPPVTNRSISTNVMLMDGETIALGGLIKSQEDNSRSFVPILGSIPLLGYLFSARSNVTRTTELVIYVTPHIINPEAQGVNLEEEFESLDRRSGFLKDNDFLGSSKAKREPKEEPKAIVPPAPVSDVPAPAPARHASPDSASVPVPQAAEPAPSQGFGLKTLPSGTLMPHRGKPRIPLPGNGLPPRDSVHAPVPPPRDSTLPK
jgi:type IV pilus assembly protein PilQ